jgi:hypothetical protein
MFNNLQQQTLKFQFSILNSQLPTDNCICYTRSIGSIGIAALGTMFIDFDGNWFSVSCRTICRDCHIFTSGKINRQR